MNIGFNPFSTSQVADKLSSDWSDFTGFFDKIGSEASRIWNNLTGKTSEELAEKNYNLQREQFDYQKQLNDLLMEREDTAYQRATKDLYSAGLSVNNLSGGAGASSLQAGTAPQINDYGQNSFMHGMNLLNTLTQFQNNITQQKINTAKAFADIEKTNAETDSIKASNDLFLYELSGRKDLFDMDFMDKKRNYGFNSQFGLFEGADPYEKYAILNNLDSKQFSDIIFSNQFNKIGLLYGLLSKIGSKLNDGNGFSIDDLLDYAGKVSDPLKNLFQNNSNVSNGSISIPDFTQMLHLKPLKKNGVEDPYHFDKRHPIRSLKNIYNNYKKKNRGSW